MKSHSKYPKYQLQQKLSPFIPILALAFLIIAFILSGSSPIGILLFWRNLCYVLAIILTIYSLAFCLRFGNYHLIVLINNILVGFDFIALIGSCLNFIFSFSFLINELALVYLTIAIVSHSLVIYYKKKRHLA